MIKRFYLFAAALLLAGCNFQNITFTGTAPGMDGSTISIISGRHKTRFGANIKDGKFEIKQQVLEEPGYYSLIIMSNNKGRGLGPYEVYLEPGKYNITLDSGNHIYPHITSTSATQNDLTVYRRFTDSINSGIRAEADKWLAKMNDPKAVLLPDKQYQDIVTKVKLSRDKADNATASTLAAFVAKYPNNKATVHAMRSMNVELNPVTFYNIYQKLTPEVKDSDEGKEIGTKLSSLVKLIPGAMAPQIVGNTPDGKPVDIASMHKKVILVEFWRSGSIKNREVHPQMMLEFAPLFNKGLGIISISFDTNKQDWLDAIKQDKITWVQVSDLKGDGSPNGPNWNITELPAYFLLDGQGRIILNDLINYREAMDKIDAYVAKH